MTTGIFFNGNFYISPTTVSQVIDSALADQNPQVGNTLVVLGESAGGEPKTPLVFSDPTSAKKAMISGDLFVAAGKVFAPSVDTGAPQKVVFMRVNPASPSTLMLKDGGNNNVIQAVSIDSGLWTLGIKLKIEAGSTVGLKVTESYGGKNYVGDNLDLDAFSILYTGAQASATMTVTNSTLTLDAPAGTPVQAISLAAYPTMQQLIDIINTVPGFAATLLDSNPNDPTLDGLDSVAAQDVKTALYTASADLQAVVNWLNSPASPLVNGVRQANAGAAPALLAYTYLAGGSDGTTTNTDWSDCFSILQAFDCNWIAVLSPDPSIHAMLSAHVIYMSTVGKSERRGFVGLATGESISGVVTAAGTLNNDRVYEVYAGYYDYNAAGVLTLYDPYLKGAIIGAMAAAVTPGTSLTNKSLNIQGEEVTLRNPADTDTLIAGGVLCTAQDPPGSGPFKVIQSVSTWIENNYYDKVELSTGAAVDYAVRYLRGILGPIVVGSTGSPTLLGEVFDATDAACEILSTPAPNGPGIFVGDPNNPNVSPPFKNIQVSINGNVTQVSLQASPGIPQNYCLISLYLVPFSGTATSAGTGA
jgi:hypothetical protein